MYSYVQIAQNTTAEDSTTTVATGNFGAALTAHNLLFAGAFYDGKDNSTSLSGLSITLTDTLGNTFTPIGTVDDGTNGYRLALFYAKDVSGGTDSITAHYSGAAASAFYKAVFAAEYSGLDTSAPFTSGEFEGGEQTITGSLSTDQLTTSSTPVLAAQPCVVIGFSSILHSGDGAPAAGTGFTQRSHIWTFGSGTNFACLEDKRVTSTAAVTATFTPLSPVVDGDLFTNAVVVFKEQSTSTGTTRRKGMSAGFENMGAGMQMRGGHRDVPAYLHRNWRQRGTSRIFLLS